MCQTGIGAIFTDITFLLILQTSNLFLCHPADLSYNQPKTKFEIYEVFHNISLKTRPLKPDFIAPAIFKKKTPQSHHGLRWNLQQNLRIRHVPWQLESYNRNPNLETNSDPSSPQSYLSNKSHLQITEKNLQRNTSLIFRI